MELRIRLRSVPVVQGRNGTGNWLRTMKRDTSLHILDLLRLLYCYVLRVSRRKSSPRFFSFPEKQEKNNN